ncbi:MAG: dihydrodipicolinate synthase family protein [Phycisphaeraceae bacterium]
MDVIEKPAVAKTAKRHPLGGVLPVFQLPFRDDETIDEATLKQELLWLLDQGADGVVMAMVSEVLRLSDTERRQVAELAVAAVAGRGTAIISVGHESSYVACELARHAEAIGAHAVMAIPPISVAPDETQTRKYYQKIAEALTIPLIVQDASGYVGRPMSIALQAGLLAEFGPRILFKPEAIPIGPRLSALLEATDGKACILEGTGGIALVDSYRRGIIGTMPGSDLIAGIVALWRALQVGDDRRIYELSLPISSLIALTNSLDAFLAVEKHLLVKQGVFKNTIVRGPVGYLLDEKTREEVDRLFAMLCRTIENQRLA